MISLQEDFSTSASSIRILNDDFIKTLYEGLSKSYQSSITLDSFNSLIKDFFAIRELDDLLIIYLAHHKWQSHDIITTWLPESVLPINAKEIDIRKKMKALLTRKIYFNTCFKCGEFQSTFHLGGNVCYSCLENNHGFIF